MKTGGKRRLFPARECEKEACFTLRVAHRRSPPVLNSEHRMVCFTLWSNMRGEHSAHPGSTTVNTARVPGSGPRVVHIPHIVDQKRSISDEPQCATIGWPEGDPLCAEASLPTGFNLVYPSSIRSFSLFYPERRNNSAQTDIPTVTLLRSGRRREASFTILIAVLSPGSSLRVMPRTSVVHRAQTSSVDHGRCTQGGVH